MMNCPMMAGQTQQGGMNCPIPRGHQENICDQYRERRTNEIRLNRYNYVVG